MGRVLLIPLLLVSAGATAQSPVVTQAPPVPKRLQLPPPEGVPRSKLPKAWDLSPVLRLDGDTHCQVMVEKTTYESPGAPKQAKQADAPAKPRHDGCAVIRRDTADPWAAMGGNPDDKI